MSKDTIIAASLALALSSCAAPVATTTTADPVIVAKIKYVCAYSGLWKLVGVGSDILPVTGAAYDAVDAGVKTVCNDPERYAALYADGKNLVNTLIGKFKAVGKM